MALWDSLTGTISDLFGSASQAGDTTGMLPMPENQGAAGLTDWMSGAAPGLGTANNSSNMGLGMDVSQDPGIEAQQFGLSSGGDQGMAAPDLPIEQVQAPQFSQQQTPGLEQVQPMSEQGQPNINQSPEQYMSNLNDLIQRNPGNVVVMTDGSLLIKIGDQWKKFSGPNAAGQTVASPGSQQGAQKG